MFLREEVGMDMGVGRENGWGGKMSGVGSVYCREGGEGNGEESREGVCMQW